MTAFQGWNYWEATPTWAPKASFFASDWSLLPVGRAFVDLVHNEWSTRCTLVTDSEGTATFRGFKGDYTLAVQRPNAPPQTSTATLNGDTEVTVRDGPAD